MPDSEMYSTKSKLFLQSTNIFHYFLLLEYELIDSKNRNTHINAITDDRITSSNFPTFAWDIQPMLFRTAAFVMLL